ncbi:MAG: zeta toxin family protein [Pseudomonadota bacterium]
MPDTERDRPPVLTIFAGPNGSGKSLLKKLMDQHGVDLGTYINADEIALGLKSESRSKNQSDLNRDAFHRARAKRSECIEAGCNFSFETVFSHESNIDTIRQAKHAGYFIVFNFITTENSLINVGRVAQRVAAGGHDIPREKIIARYRRCMALLPDATILAHQSRFFDNSDTSTRLVGQIDWNKSGQPQVELFTPLPKWISHWASEFADRLRRQGDHAQ